MSQHALQRPIEELWERRDTLSSATGGAARDAVRGGAGPARLRARARRRADGRRLAGQSVAEEGGAAVVPADRLDGDGRARAARRFGQGAAEVRRLGRRTASARRGFRAVPGAVVRRSAYIAPGVVLMPSFVNVGAYVGRNTMVDTWATVGSCAQIGANCHLSGGVGIGGVLEPLQANPVIIEDDCFVGARSEVAEGVVVERGSVLSMGVFIGASTKMVDRATGRDPCRPRAGLFGGGAGLAAGQAAAGRIAGAFAVLRGDRQDGRRADPREDLDQRTVARLIMAPSPHPLPQGRGSVVSTFICSPAPLAGGGWEEGANRDRPSRPPAARPGADPLPLGHARRCRRAGRSGRRAQRDSASPSPRCATARSTTCSRASAPDRRISASPATPMSSRSAPRTGNPIPSPPRCATASSTAAAPAT